MLHDNHKRGGLRAGGPRNGELNSERFGQGIRDALRVCGRPETLLTRPGVADQHANQVRRALLAATRGYGEDRGIFEHFPATVRWEWAWLTAAELAQVRYIEYSYWNEISGAAGWLPTRLRISGRACGRTASQISGSSGPPAGCCAGTASRRSSWPAPDSTSSSAWKGISG